MNESDLKRFAEQLSVWAELVIEHGRTPFRRVELFPRLHTRLGHFEPPLVFWINRQSLMAGGVILLPDNDLPRQMDLGCATAEALGLQYFVTWESDRVRIWKVTDNTPEEAKQFPVAVGEAPELYRALLLEVMEQLKLFSVLGMVPPRELSAYYIHNLFQETLDSALSPLITTFRQTRAAGQLSESTRSDRQAEQLNRLTLLRLIALLWHDNLPNSIMPEKLERAIELGLPALPTELLQALSFSHDKQDPPLPNESAVCYHHLLMRLRQIEWNTPTERAVLAINQLLNPDRQGFETAGQAPDTDPPLLLINPDIPLLGRSDLHELSDNQAFLAAAALLRYINELPPAQQYLGTLFSFTAPPLPASKIRGKLINRRKVPREERQRYDAQLRTSWATRRFKFASDTPCWVLETIHLLGLSPSGAELHLEIPITWLTAPFGQILQDLIIDNFQIEMVALGEGSTKLQLRKEKVGPSVTTVLYDEEERQIDWNETAGAMRPLLLLSLLLPTDQYQLIFSDRFQSCSDASTSTITDAGLLTYSNSSLGQCLWKVLGGSKVPGSAAELRQLGTELGWFTPDEKVLYQLGLSNEDGTDIKRSLAELDQHLGELLDSSVPIGLACPKLPKMPTIVSPNRQATTGNEREEILHHLDIFGIPDFPQQYLYQLDKPQLTTYRFQPPLQVVSELLGQFELSDGEEQRLIVYGEVTVEALKLCADQGQTEVELPKDQHQLNTILSAYRNDLKRLRRELTRETHTRLENPQSAERLAKKLWQELNLPPWKWLGH